MRRREGVPCGKSPLALTLGKSPLALTLGKRPHFRDPKNTMLRTSIALLLLLTAACTTVSEPASVHAEVRAYSQHVFRGVSQTDGKALQVLSDWTIDLGEGQHFSLGTFVNADGTNDAGDGEYPGRNGGQITRVEVQPTWSWDLNGGFFSAGIVNRSHPNLEDEKYGDTSEAKLTWALGSKLFGMQPSFTTYYDLEDGDGLYAQFGVGSDFEINPDWSLATSFSLAYADKDQATLLYHSDEAGFADLTGETVLRWRTTPNLDLTATVAASTIVSNELAKDLKVAGRDDANFWLGFGLSWNF